MPIHYTADSLFSCHNAGMVEKLADDCIIDLLLVIYLPNCVAPAWENCFLNSSNDPKLSSMAAFNSPDGSPILGNNILLQ